MTSETLAEPANVALKKARGDPEKALPGFLEALNLSRSLHLEQQDRVATVARAYLYSRATGAGTN